MIVVPVVLVASVTGALWVFNKELEPIFYRDLHVVQPQPTRASYQDQLAAARQVAGETRITQLRVNFAADRSTQVIRTEEGQRRTIFVDPYTAKVLGERGKSFFDVVLDLHRRLMMGSVGRIMVELATSWSMVLVLTGVYLWWPRGRQRFWGIWLPRIRAKTYLIWRDLHSVSSFYLATLSFLVLITGLLFSFAAGPLWIVTTQQLGGLPGPPADGPPKSVLPQEGATPISPDEALRIASRYEFPADSVSVVLPSGPNATYGLSFLNDRLNPPLLAQVVLDQYSGAELQVTRWEDYPLGGRILLYAVPIHFGTLWGMPTKVLAFAVCLIFVFASISGVVMWWVRRPQGKSGFPAPVDRKLPKWLIATILGLGVLLPTLGLSIVIILLGEWLYAVWQRRSSAGRT